MRTYPASFKCSLPSGGGFPPSGWGSPPKVAAPHQWVCWYLHVGMELPKSGFCWGNEIKNQLKCTQVAASSIRRSPVGFSSWAGLIFLAPISPPKFSMGVVGQEDAGAAQGPKQGSNGARDGQKGPQDLAQDRIHLEWLLLAIGLKRVTHVTLCFTVPPESQSLICCLSFPTCEVDEVMTWGRVFIFPRTNSRTLQERERSKGCWVLPVSTTPIPSLLPSLSKLHLFLSQES